MKTEFEIKVLDIDEDLLRQALAESGFKKVGNQQFRRYVYDLETEGAWIRLRTDGAETTLTYKYAKADAIDGVQELEVTVSDFEETNQLLVLIGLTPRQYQENTRELYSKGSVEVTIDSWPLIPPYAEIESDSEKAVTDTLDLLGLSAHKTTSLPTSEVYKQYGLDLDSYKHLSFSEETTV